MKYVYATFNILEAIFAIIGLYIVLMITISVLSGEGTLNINGHCFGKCDIEAVAK